MNKIAGVYAITNKRNGKQYIGSSVDIYKRWGVHRTYLSQGRHHSAALQAEWNEQQGNGFVPEVLEETEVEHLIEREQWYLDTRQPAYNVSKIAGNAFRDPAIQARLPRGREAREYTKESAAKISAALMGRSLSAAHCANISASQIDRELTPEWRKNISLGMTDNPKVKGPKSEAHRESIQGGMKQKWEDPVYRARMVEARRNRKPSQPRSQESRNRSKQARTAAWQRQLAEGYTGPERDTETGRFLKS